MTTWLAIVEYDSSDPVHAPTALQMSISELSYRRLDDAAGRRLELRFPVAASTLRAATEAALRLARRAMRAADMAWPGHIGATPARPGVAGYRSSRTTLSGWSSQSHCRCSVAVRPKRSMPGSPWSCHQS